MPQRIAHPVNLFSYETRDRITIGVDLNRAWFDQHRLAITAVIDVIEDAVTKVRVVMDDTPPGGWWSQRLNGCNLSF